MESSGLTRIDVPQPWVREYDNNQLGMEITGMFGVVLSKNQIRPRSWSFAITEHIQLIIILISYGLMSVVWALAVPMPRDGQHFMNPDETSHYDVIRYIADHCALPPYVMPYYEGVHPPLYHILGALLIGFGPLAVRLLNVLIGGITLTILYQLAKIYPPVNPITCVSLLAFLPLFLTESGAITNDILAVMLGAAATYNIVRGYRDGFDTRRTIILSLALAAGALTKYQCLVFIPTAIVAMLMRKAYRLIAFTAIAIAFLSGWWYTRNILIFGDPFRQRAEASLLSFLFGYQDLHVSAFEYWRNVIVSAIVTLPGFYRDWLPLPVYVVYATLFVVVAVQSIYQLRSVRMSQEVVLLLAPIIGVLALWASYNYHHFMPSLRLTYPAAAPLCVVIAHLLRKVTPSAIIIPMALCALLAIVEMPNQWISPSNEPTFRHWIMPYRTTPLPTSLN